MERLAAIIAGIVLLGVIDAVLERRGGGLGVTAAVLGLTGGGVIGCVFAFGLALAVTPGAPVAVLCPTCYEEPAAEAVRRAGLVYFAILGVLAGLLPGAAYRTGFTVGAAVAVAGSAGYWTQHGAGAAILVGVALTALGWAIHRAAGWGPATRASTGRA